MAIKKIEQIKKTKWFRIWDLIVYAAIVALIVALFLAVFLTKDKTPASGFKVSYKGAAVFEYDFSSAQYKILSQDNVEITSESATELRLTFYTDGKAGYNKLLVDKSAKSVKVVEADCSTHRDCVYSPAIKDRSTIISCSPHAMLIEPVGRKITDDGDVVVG